VEMVVVAEQSDDHLPADIQRAVPTPRKDGARSEAHSRRKGLRDVRENASLIKAGIDGVDETNINVRRDHETIALKLSRLH